MSAILVIGTLFLIVWGLASYAEAVYRRRFYRGRVRAISETCVSVMALLILLSVIIELGATIIHLK